MKNLILGFDPGLNITGWGVIKNHGNIEKHINHGLISTNKKNSLGSRLNLIYEQVLNILDTYKPNSIAVEKIFSMFNE